MKTATILISIFVAMLIATFASADQSDSSRVEKKIIKTIMITDDGKIMIDSTFITEGDKVTVHVDSTMIYSRTPGNKRDFRQMKEIRMMSGNDEMNDEYQVTVEMEGDSGQTMIIKNPSCKQKVIKFEGDSLTRNCKTMTLHNPNVIPCPPPPPLPPIPGQINNHSNTIDLSDPSIISYEKKIQKNGTEKITIIRKLK